MIAATRKWFRRYRTPVAIGLGVVGVGYVATQYVLGAVDFGRYACYSADGERYEIFAPMALGCY